MVRVNGMHWTADFTISRALAEAYRASGKDEVIYFCVGDPRGPLDRLGPSVGSELVKYYPHVVGTLDKPVSTGRLVMEWEMVTSRWPNAFVIGIEATDGPDDSVGFIEVSDRGIRRRPPQGNAPAWMGDVGVSACLWTGAMPEGLTPEQYNRQQRIADAIVDGQIRFLQRVKKYEPEL